MTADFHVRDIQALGGYVDRAMQWVSDVRSAAATAMQRLDLIRQNGRMAVRKIESDVDEIEEELAGVESELASLNYETMKWTVCMTTPTGSGEPRCNVKSTGYGRSAEKCRPNSLSAKVI